MKLDSQRMCRLRLRFYRCLFQITVIPYWNWLRLINKEGSLTTSALWAYCGNQPRRLWPALNLLCPCSCCWSRTGTNRWNFTVIHRASPWALLISMCCDERGGFQVNAILFFRYLVNKMKAGESSVWGRLLIFLIYHWEYFSLSFWCLSLCIGSVYFELSLRNWSVVRNHFSRHLWQGIGPFLCIIRQELLPSQWRHWVTRFHIWQLPKFPVLWVNPVVQPPKQFLKRNQD